MAKKSLLNKDLADLNNDGKLSSYEKRRGMAIEESMQEREPYKFGKLVSGKASRKFTSQATGKDVVLAAINDIEDNKNVKEFLKEIAFVESKFGKDKNTFKEQTKSVFQIDEIAFKELQRRLNPESDVGENIRKYNENLKINKGIDLTQISFDDLNRPVIGAAATRALLLSFPGAIPDTVKGRAKYWKDNWNTLAKNAKGTVSKYLKDLEMLREQRRSGGLLDDDMMRMGYQEGGEMDEMEAMPMNLEDEVEEVQEVMPEEENEMLPDEEMEQNFIDFIVDEALSEEEESMLMEQLEANPELSMVFDKVIEKASEFTGAGPVDGPGTGTSDDIPARLSDGEFVFTAKAVEQIGADNLMQMMKEAEAAYDAGGERKGYANGEEVIQDENINRGIKKVEVEYSVQQQPTSTESLFGQPLYEEDETSKQNKELMRVNPTRHVYS